MTASRLHFSLTATLILAAIGHAQTPVPPHMVAIGKAIEWPGSLGGGSFGATEPAQLTPYSGTGLVMDWGSTLVYSHSPMTHNICIDTGVQATSFAVYPGDINAGILDVVIVGTPMGLATVEFDGSSGAIDFTTSDIPGTSAAADAAALVCDDFDGDGDTDIAAAHSDALAITTYYANGDGSFSTGASFTQSHTIRDIEAIEWTDIGDQPGHEIAVLSGWGTQIYSQSGVLLWSRLSANGNHEIAVVGPYVGVAPFSTVETLDKLALVQPGSSGGEQVSLHSVAGSENASNLGNIGVVGLDAGDFDGDGDWDLAVSQRSSHELWLLHNRTYDPVAGEYQFNKTFSANASYRSELRIGEVRNLPMPNNTADPCLADITGDGFVDVMTGVRDEDPQHGGNSLYRVAGEGDGDFEDNGECPNVFSNYRIATGGEASMLYGLNGGVNPLVTNANYVIVDFEVSNVWAYLWQPSPPQVQNLYLEVTVWKQLECDDLNVQTSPIKHIVYHVDPATPEGEGFMKQSSTVKVGFSVDTPGGGGTAIEFPDKYYAELRLVRNVDGTLTGPFSAEIISLTGQVDQPTNINCLSTPHLANDPGVYSSCSSMPPTLLSGEPPDIEYDTEAYAQAQIPTPVSGHLLYPELQTVSANP